MVNPRDANTFASSFIQGFSFIDAIKQRKKSEARIEQQLADRREEASFQRGRQNRSDRRLSTIFKQQQDDRLTIKADKKRAQEGERLAADPNTPIEDLRGFVDVSPSARARVGQDNQTKRLGKALKSTSTIPQAGFAQSLGPGARQQQPTTPAENVVANAPRNAEGLPTMTPQERVDHAALVNGEMVGKPVQDFTFGKDRGLSSLQDVSVGDASRSDPAASQSFGGRIRQGAAGFGSQFLRAGEDVVAAVAQNIPPVLAARSVISSITGKPDPIAPQNIGNEFTGTLQVPADRFTTPEEFQTLNDNGASQQEIQDAKDSNRAVLQELGDAGRKPRAFAIDSFTQQGALLEGSDQLRKAALVQQNKAITRAESTLDPNQDSVFEQVALKDPRAASVMYLQDRNTLVGAGREDLVTQLDRRVIPVLEAAQAELQAEITADPVSQVARRNLKALKDLNKSFNTIAADQPHPARQAGIRPPGLKIGDNERANNVVDVLFDENNPAPSAVQPGQIRAAAAVVGRISPSTKRLNDTQIQGLSVLAEGGYLSKPVALSIAMTGTWPPGANPSKIVDTVKSGETVYAVTAAGQYYILPDPVGDRNRKKTDAVDLSLGDQQFTWAALGAASTGMDESRNNQLIGLMSDHAGFIRKFFNVDNQESMVAAGRVFGQSIFLSAAEHKRMGNDFNPFTNPKNAPTAEEIFLNPVLRTKIAEEYNSRPVPMPPIGKRSDLDLEPFKVSLRSGVHGAALKAAAEGDLSEEDTLYIWWALNAGTADIAAANTTGQ